jgi:hypothetical protein
MRTVAAWALSRSSVKNRAKFNVVDGADGADTNFPLSSHFRKRGYSALEGDAMSASEALQGDLRAASVNVDLDGDRRLLTAPYSSAARHHRGAEGP